MPSVGTYLGVTVLVIEDHGDGWVTAIFPDAEQPKRGRMLTYNKDERWRLWREQVTETIELPPALFAEKEKS